MIRRFISLILFGSLFLPCLISPDAHAQSGQQYDTPVSASQTNTAVSFGFNATSITLKNDGPNSVRLKFTSSTATTSSFELKVTETLSLTVDRSSTGWTGFGAICSSGQTAVVRVLAIKNL